MYEIKVETHAHSIASQHAYSTITELCTYAKSVGMEGVAITDHGPLICDGSHEWHFINLRILPRIISGVYLIRGIESNILDFDGKIDLSGSALKHLDWVIASIHSPCLEGGSADEITKAYLGALNNPFVDCLGHIGQANYMCDFEAVVKEAAKLDKVIEINNHSVFIRPGSQENCTNVAKYAKKYCCKIAVSSDAHYHDKIGKYDHSINILKNVDFPEELIINTNINRFSKYIYSRKGINILE